MPDTHPLRLGDGLIHREARDHVSQTDVMLALGSELSATAVTVRTWPVKGKLRLADDYTH